ncbi:hypothetical protein JTE90_004946 [Oedothorax gibbosus]|uniref:Uncharacterized protein n=1 Tax=Oedothorax gibbosus TaxID=931172 RepID=A0AAV6V912_9ARAC|nr:hypothetical protein JTE90_004946 [Oedothorax gibbosus]
MDLTKTKIDTRPPRSKEDWIRNIRMIIGSQKWDFSVIKHLVSLNPSLINVDRFHYKKTLLEMMVTDDRGTEDAVRFLIEHGADVNLKSGRLLLDAFRWCRRRPEIVKVLIDSGVILKDEYGGVSALSEAIFGDFEVDVLSMIVDGGVDVNHVDQRGQTPLCRALDCGRDFEVVRFLLDSGARVDVCQCHRTPLHCLCSSGRKIKITTRVVELLLRNGAGGGNIVVDGFERTVLHNALRHSFYEERAMCILIRNEIIDIHARDSRDSTYLHEALYNASACTLGVVKCLIELGAKVHTVDRSGETPLHVALLNRSCDIEIIRYLLKQGSPVNVPNRAGETATVIAVHKSQCLPIIRLLLASGERVNHPRWSSLMVAFDCFATVRSVYNIAVFQTLLKFAFLENPGLDITRVIELDRARCGDPNVWNRFWNMCLLEVDQLTRLKTLSGMPLLNVFGYGTLPETSKPDMRNSYESLTDHESKCIMQVLKYNRLPLYAEILKAKLGSEFLLDTFCDIRLSAFYEDDKNKKFSVLTSPCLEYIGKFLSRDEQLFMILHSHDVFAPSSRNQK